MNLQKNTPAGKGIRTTYQGLIAVALHLPVIVLIPEVRELLDRAPALIGVTVVAVAGIISYFQNQKGL